MINHRKIPIRLVLGLLIAIALDTAVQLFWKTAVTETAEDSLSSPFSASPLAHPLFLIVGVLMVCQLLNWLKVLGQADLSYAKPITSLSYVSVCVLSAVYLKETVDLIQIAGIGFVLAGVWFISQTDHATAPEIGDGK